MSHGTMQIHWVEHFALELMACLFVYLTVWGLAQSYFFELLPMVLKPSKYMRLPTTGEEYARLALDICGILFSAILFHFMLTYAIVSACAVKIKAWAKSE